MTEFPGQAGKGGQQNDEGISIWAQKCVHEVTCLLQLGNCMSVLSSQHPVLQLLGDGTWHVVFVATVILQSRPLQMARSMKEKKEKEKVQKESGRWLAQSKL
ncbi:hypothetical protein H1C71_023889 [Ictidomys tridecemlineatus]|nr:hypothetical protein H1C71_023889 [Ictidomys tridecemlineatus]